MAHFEKSLFLVLIGCDSEHFSPLYAFNKMEDAEQAIERLKHQYPDSITKIDYLPLFS